VKMNSFAGPAGFAYASDGKATRKRSSTRKYCCTRTIVKAYHSGGTTDNIFGGNGRRSGSRCHRKVEDIDASE
jgi:hypothetical protein